MVQANDIGICRNETRSANQGMGTYAEGAFSQQRTHTSRVIRGFYLLLNPC